MPHNLQDQVDAWVLHETQDRLADWDGPDLAWWVAWHTDHLSGAYLVRIVLVQHLLVKERLVPFPPQEHIVRAAVLEMLMELGLPLRRS